MGGARRPKGLVPIRNERGTPATGFGRARQTNKHIAFIFALPAKPHQTFKHGLNTVRPGIGQGRVVSCAKAEFFVFCANAPIFDRLATGFHPVFQRVGIFQIHKLVVRGGHLIS